MGAGAEMAAAVVVAGEAAAAAAAAGAGGKKRGASRSWILFDAAGEERVLDADKYAIMHRVDINARDLRILDPLLSYPSTILGRERAIVLNLEVRAPQSPRPTSSGIFGSICDGLVERRIRDGEFPGIITPNFACFLRICFRWGGLRCDSCSVLLLRVESRLY